jgi:hypothetical protein
MYAVSYTLCVWAMKNQVQLTLEEGSFRYLRTLVDKEEDASLLHAVRQTIKEYRQPTKHAKAGGS